MFRLFCLISGIDPSFLKGMLWAINLCIEDDLQALDACILAVQCHDNTDAPNAVIEVILLEFIDELCLAKVRLN